jgi:hypothetical protein
MDRPEDALQLATAQTLDALGWCWQHVPGEVYLHGDKEQRARQMRRMKERGFRPGMPDVMIYEWWRYPECVYQYALTHFGGRLVGGFGVAIELKAGRRKATDPQEAWMADLRERGWLVEVCRTIDEVRATLRHVRAVNGRRLR